MIKKNGLIYKATNIKNGKIYIGLTTNKLKNRIRQHFYGKSYFGRSLRKYGSENFIWEVLEVDIPNENLRQREIFYIYKYQSNNSIKGYNLTDGGDGNLIGNRKKRITTKWDDPTTLEEYLNFIDFMKINRPNMIDEYKSIINDKIKMLCLV